MRLQLYADRRFLPPGFRHCPIMYPFWGATTWRGDELVDGDRFGRYMLEGLDVFTLSGLPEADVAVLPFNWEQIEDYHKEHPDWDLATIATGRAQAHHLAEELAISAAQSGKPLLAFYVCDDDSRALPLATATVFRPSLRRTTRRPNEYPMPALRADFVESYCGGHLPLRKKSKKPVVGYCGYDNLRRRSRRDQIRHHLGRIPSVSRVASSLGIDLIRHVGSRVRSQSLYSLSRSRDVVCNFKVRDSFWNGSISRHSVDVARAHQSRQEYVDNMLGSDYVLCVRGQGNYSFRFYETLSCGRIPVFVDTDCVLPFEEWVAYRDCCVWVKESELSEMGKKVAEFHERLSPKEFEAMQLRCRRLWLDWLSPEGFFRNIHRYVR